jgi:hypothetical protein
MMAQGLARDAQLAALEREQQQQKQQLAQSTREVGARRDEQDRDDSESSGSGQESRSSASSSERTLSIVCSVSLVFRCCLGSLCDYHDCTPFGVGLESRRPCIAEPTPGAEACTRA